MAFASIDAAPVPFAWRCDDGSPAPVPPEGREYDTGAGIGEGFTVATGGGLAAAGAGAARAGSARKGAVLRSPPLGGGLDAVTADYPL
ncbi:MAG TPA: hypothetical protein VK337_21140 [Xanthobacteraceae bacterium]|nr:hypothetical protein [Xanthobacteraceae bacterium]